MEHNVSLITTIAAAFGLALIFGFAAERLKVPVLVGYLLAGIMIGPATSGFVADVGIASQLSEIGVMLLMFGVGLHFSLEDLLAVKRIAVPGAVVQMGLATVLGSMALNSFVFAAVAPLRNWVLERSELARRLERREDPFAELPMSTERKYLEGQVVLVGYGRVGRRIAEALRERGPASSTLHPRLGRRG